MSKANHGRHLQNSHPRQSSFGHMATLSLMVPGRLKEEYLKQVYSVLRLDFDISNLALLQLLLGDSVYVWSERIVNFEACYWGEALELD